MLKGIENGVYSGCDTYRVAPIEPIRWRSAPASSAIVAWSQPMGTDQGNAMFNEASSILGASALNLPLQAVDEAPVGIQLIGRWHSDARA